MGCSMRDAPIFLRALDLIDLFVEILERVAGICRDIHLTQVAVRGRGRLVVGLDLGEAAFA